MPPTPLDNHTCPPLVRLQVAINTVAAPSVEASSGELFMNNDIGGFILKGANFNLEPKLYFDSTLPENVVQQVRERASRPSPCLMLVVPLSKPAVPSLYGTSSAPFVLGLRSSLQSLVLNVVDPAAVVTAVYFVDRDCHHQGLQPQRKFWLLGTSPVEGRARTAQDSRDRHRRRLGAAQP